MQGIYTLYSFQVHRSQDGESETTVEITGEPEAREKAKGMIEELVTPLKSITEMLRGTTAAIIKYYGTVQYRSVER